MKKLLLTLASVAVFSCTYGDDGLKNLRGKELDFDNIFLREVKYEDWEYIGADRGVIDEVIENILSENKDKEGLLDRATLSYEDGNWEYEWDKVAKEAEINGDVTAASAYYTISSYPFFKDSNKNHTSYVVKAMENHKKQVLADGFGFEKIEVETPQGSAYANLHLPKEVANEMPVVIFTGGSDVFSIEYYRLFKDYLVDQGIAFITFELPGMGINGHLTYTPDTNIVHRGVIDWIKNDGRFGKIAVGASSLGGQPAVRTAFTNEDDIVAVVNYCGALSHVWKGITPETFSYYPLLNQVVLADRTGLSIDDFASVAKEYSLEEQGLLGKKKTTVPIFSLNTATDPVAPKSDMLLATNASAHGITTIVESEVGHGMSRDIALPLISGYLVDILK